MAEDTAPEYLAHGDLVALILAEGEMRTAEQKRQIAELNCQLLRLETETKLAQNERRAQDAQADAVQAQSRYRLLAQDTAARYKLSWHNASFVPETGEIVRNPA